MAEELGRTAGQHAHHRRKNHGACWPEGVHVAGPTGVRKIRAAHSSQRPRFLFPLYLVESAKSQSCTYPTLCFTKRSHRLPLGPSPSDGIGWKGQEQGQPSTRGDVTNQPGAPPPSPSQPPRQPFHGGAWVLDACSHLGRGCHPAKALEDLTWVSRSPDRCLRGPGTLRTRGRWECSGSCPPGRSLPGVDSDKQDVHVLCRLWNTRGTVPGSPCTR